MDKHPKENKKGGGAKPAQERVWQIRPQRIINIAKIRKYFEV